MKHRSRPDVKRRRANGSGSRGSLSKILAACERTLSAKPVSPLASAMAGKLLGWTLLKEIAMTDSEDWWGTVDADTLRCLSENGPMTPAELGKRLGISEDGATSLVSHLAREGRVRICLVESAG
jgi:Winged helix-turn-helix DNA-binding